MSFLFFSSYTEEPATGKEETTNNKQTANKKADGTGLSQVVEAIKAPHDANLAGELVPLHNFDAKERLDRELMVNSYWHSSTLMLIKLSNRYFPVIEPILAEQGVPDDFKYLAVIESSLRNAVSPAGARGLWQFMPATGKGYGMIINTEVDQRYHVEKATKIACKYLKHLKSEFGTWTNAAAAYNMGETRMRNLMKNQQEKNYYDIEMNAESARYVSRIIAVKEIMSNPTQYGFYLDQEDLYPPLTSYKIVEVKTAIPSWADFAKKQGITYRMLKVYNPWLREGKLTNTAKRTYEIKIPV